jgi:heme-degrading monooxygenase HmoA
VNVARLDSVASRNANEVKMFARKVAARLKPNALPEFLQVMEKEIVPWLRKQEGFVDLIVLALQGSEEVATISFWDHEADAEAWAAGSSPEALEILGGLLDGRPYVKTFDVVSSTLHELASGLCRGL